MTYDTSRIDDKRIPVTVCNLTLDFCANTYGVAPCTATGAVGSECYNTYETCQDIPNYIKTTKDYTFYQPVSNWKIGKVGYPCLNGGVTFTPTKIDPRGSLGQRGIVSVKMSDFADDDIFTDPYFATRSYDPESQGTFFGKLKRRNIYIKGRPLKIGQGYINEPFSFNDFDYRLYVAESLNVDTKGNVTLSGKDLLKLADDKRSVAPKVSTGTLSAAYTAGDTTLILQTGEGVDYDASGKVAIGSNVLSYTSVSIDTLTGVSGGQDGSKDENLNVDDSVQQCLVYSNANVVDIIHGLLKTYARIDESYLPYDAGLTVPTGTNAEWDDQKEAWLENNNLTFTVIEPTGVNSLVEKLCKQNLIYIWFDERTNKVNLHAIAPKLGNKTLKTLTDDSHIIANSASVKDNIKDRISQIWVYYDIIDVTKDAKKSDNYNNLIVHVDSETENVNSYNEKARLVIYADTLSANNAGAITTLTGRLLSRYAKNPKIIKLKLDTKDIDFWSGDEIIVDSFYFQDATGANEKQKVQLLKITDTHDKQIIEIEGNSIGLLEKVYGFIAPDTMGDYTTESAENQLKYGYISDNNGLYSNGDKGHLIA